MLGSLPPLCTQSSNKLWVAGSNGRINRLNLETGDSEWHDDVGGRILSAPVRVGSILYFATGYRNLYGYYL